MGEQPDAIKTAWAYRKPRVHGDWYLGKIPLCNVGMQRLFRGQLPLDVRRLRFILSKKRKPGFRKIEVVFRGEVTALINLGDDRAYVYIEVVNYLERRPGYNYVRIETERD